MGAAFAAAAVLELVREAPAEVRRQIPVAAVFDALAVELDEIHADGLALDRRLDVLERIQGRR